MKPSVFTAPLLAVALAGAFGSAPAAAQHGDAPRIDQARQQIRERIDDGIANGRIAPHEALRTQIAAGPRNAGLPLPSVRQCQ